MNELILIISILAGFYCIFSLDSGPTFRDIDEKFKRKEEEYKRNNK